MFRQRSNRDGGGQRNAAGDTYHTIFFIRPVLTGAVLAAVFVAGLAGCSGEKKRVIINPPEQTRLENLMKFYRIYTAQKGKPPKDEKALKEFVAGLPQDQKEAAGVADDLDSLFVSPRDGKKYVVLYNTVSRPGGPEKAVAWEEDGKDGWRYVMLAMGYSKLCDDATFQKIKGKK